MTGQRRGLVGQGYMPKGGRAAAAAHNAAVAARSAAPLVTPTPDPQPETMRSDGRASGRSAWSSPERIAVVVSGVAAVVSPWLAVAVLR